MHLLAPYSGLSRRRPERRERRKACGQEMLKRASEYPGPAIIIPGITPRPAAFAIEFSLKRMRKMRVLILYMIRNPPQPDHLQNTKSEWWQQFNSRVFVYEKHRKRILELKKESQTT